MNTATSPQECKKGLSFKDLIVWQRAFQLTIAIYHLTSSFPGSERFGLCNQIQRAAVSVVSNIAEGNGQSTTVLYLKHLGIARGSNCEVEAQLMIAKELGFRVPEVRTLADLLIAIYFLVSHELADYPVSAERHIRRMKRIVFVLATLLGPSPGEVPIERLFAIDVMYAARLLTRRAAPAAFPETVAGLEYLIDHARAFQCREVSADQSSRTEPLVRNASIPPHVRALVSHYLWRSRVDPDASADDSDYPENEKDIS